MVLIFHFEYTLKWRLQFVSIRTSLKFWQRGWFQYTPLFTGVLKVSNHVSLRSPGRPTWTKTFFCWPTFCKYKDPLTHYQTTNFRLFQTETVCRRQFLIWQKWQKVIQTGRKHCGKRRNCSLQAISPFPSVFKRLVSQGRQKVSLCGNGLTHYQTTKF